MSSNTATSRKVRRNCGDLAEVIVFVIGSRLLGEVGSVGGSSGRRGGSWYRMVCGVMIHFTIGCKGFFFGLVCLLLQWLLFERHGGSALVDFIEQLLHRHPAGLA